MFEAFKAAKAALEGQTVRNMALAYDMHCLGAVMRYDSSQEVRDAYLIATARYHGGIACEERLQANFDAAERAYLATVEVK